jgi:hypothetical protein
MITLIGTNAACFECETNLIAMGINVINNTNMNQLPFIRKTSNSNKRTTREKKTVNHTLNSKHVPHRKKLVSAFMFFANRTDFTRDG